MSRRERILNAISLAHQGQFWLKEKWEGEYGQGYPASTREYRIKDITSTMNDLASLKRDIKNGARI